LSAGGFETIWLRPHINWMPSYSHPRPKRSAARSLIEAAMSGGNEPLAADMMRMAVVAGIGEATWFTAKKEAGIGSRLDGNAWAVRSALGLDPRCPSWTPRI